MCARALCCVAALACASAQAEPKLPTFSTEERFAQALIESPLLLLFFFHARLPPAPDAGSGAGGGAGERPSEDSVDGGMATIKLATEVASLAGAFPGHVAAVDCARLPRVCAERLVSTTPAFKLWSNGRFTRYTGSLDGRSLGAFLLRKLSAQPSTLPASRASEPAGGGGGGGVVRAWAAVGVQAWALAARVAPLLGARPELLLAGGAASAVLCGLLAVYAMGIRPRSRRARRARAQACGAHVQFDGGSGWFVTPGCAADAAAVGGDGGGGGGGAQLPAVLLIGPLAPADKRLRREQRAAVERIALKLSARGMRCLVLEPPDGGAAALGSAVATIAAAADWLRHTPDAHGARPAVPSRVGAVGMYDGGRILSRAARLGKCPVDCCVIFELAAREDALDAATIAAVTSAPKHGKARGGGGGGGGGVDDGRAAVLASVLAEVDALSSGRRVAVQLHVDVLDGPLGIGAAAQGPPSAAMSARHVDVRAHVAAKLRAAGASLQTGAGGSDGLGCSGSTSRLFVYGEPHAPAADRGGGGGHDDGARTDGGRTAGEWTAEHAHCPLLARSAHAAALPLLLQPDGRREVAKGFAWVRMAAFLNFHLAR
ncbi:hypothetical protein KFE25_005817 [Diacronema lutheri]|uniref:Thioredoxin domain-containing protein n=1 Tax=Diacronema lutheri TaxID=2081491 RepID=A0A8J5XVG8_DIALT|nr:hypothetical protein KFE25_005817 [Diacronema lutheri]